MKSEQAKSSVSSINADPEEQGLSIILGRFELCPFGTMIDTRTGASLGRIQYLSATSRNETVLAARAEWSAWLAHEPARHRRAA